LIFLDLKITLAIHICVRQDNLNVFLEIYGHFTGLGTLTEVPAKATNSYVGRKAGRTGLRFSNMYGPGSVFSCSLPKSAPTEANWWGPRVDPRTEYPSDYLCPTLQRALLKAKGVNKDWAEDGVKKSQWCLTVAEELLHGAQPSTPSPDLPAAEERQQQPAWIPQRRDVEASAPPAHVLSPIQYSVSITYCTSR